MAIELKHREHFERREEIITTPFTFVATAEAIIRSGATPVFVDIDPDTFNILPGAIERAITKNTVGIIPVHLYGLPCQMDEILRIARETKLFVLEDAAQAFGAEFKGKKVGAMGKVGAFSFFPSKNLGGYGDGGLVATNSSAIATLVKVLRDHGQKTKYNASYIGYNSRLDSLQAAVLLAKFPYIDRFNNLRRKHAEKYNKSLAPIPQVTIPYTPRHCEHVWHLYTIKVSSGRNRLLNFLNDRGISARLYYPKLLSAMNAFGAAKVKGELGNARKVSRQIITLPLDPFLKERELHYIVSTIQKFFKSKA